MEKYTIYCTPKQTKKAIELGAPITHGNCRFDDDELSPIGDIDGELMYAIIPTAEQMIGWFRQEKGMDVLVIPVIGANGDVMYDCRTITKVIKKGLCGSLCRNIHSYEDAILEGIAEVLEYLINKEEIVYEDKEEVEADVL